MNIAGKRILVVGGGPVGLAAALFLNKVNQNVTIIESKLERNIYSKALLTNTRTLCLLRTVGAQKKIIENGMTIAGAQSFVNDQPFFKFIFNDHKIDSNSYYGQKMVVLPQSLVEECLEQKLEEEGIKVKRGVELLKLRNTQNQEVETTLKENNQTRDQRYDMVVGCDGARSVVRHEIGAKFEGHTVPDKVMYMSDYKLPEHVAFNKIGMRFYTSPKSYMMGILPVQKNIIRVISNNPDYQNLLPVQYNERQQLWKTNFKINHRLSSKLRDGNIFLAGDAAHVHSPLGGRGMNIGIEDVYVLAELLKENRLDKYEEERYKVLKPLVKRIRNMSQFMMMENEWKYRAVGLFMKNANWLLPQTAYKNMLLFITGQDHEV